MPCFYNTKMTVKTKCVDDAFLCVSAFHGEGGHNTRCIPTVSC